MSVIKLYEKVNRKKLDEVLKCNNIPFDSADDESWKEKFLSTLQVYFKKKPKKNGIETKYEQSCNYGRYYTKYGLQTFQKDVRKYISGEFYEDIDFENCHPRIILYLLKKQNISCTSLKRYVDDKNKFLLENNISKNDFLRMLYNDIPPNNLVLKEIHQAIYNVWFDFLKNDQKALLDRVKKERTKKKKNYNISGAFISLYIQNIENDLLKIVYDTLTQKGYIIGSLMFDGLLVEKGSESVSKHFDEIEKIIKKQTGYKMKLVLKSTETEWRPFIDNEMIKLEEEGLIDSTKYSIAVSKKLEEDCKKFDDDGNFIGIDEERVKILHTYLNNFICRFNNPLSFGIRFNTSERFQFKSKEKISERIRYGFNSSNKDIAWLNSDDALTYNKIIFEPNDKLVKPDEYNLYIRPKFTKHDDNITKIEFFNYLKTVICNNDEAKYKFIIHYIAKMVQVGKTKQMIVLLGNMGCGKSSYPECLAWIVGEDYHTKVDDINQLTNNFNSLQETNIITQVEEVAHNAGSYHKVNQKLKTLTTETRIQIEKKGIDAYMSNSHSNFILVTNYHNPISITKDNRRAFICRVSNCKINDAMYFKSMKEELVANIEQVRDYFYNFEYVDDLNSIRPTTEEELTLLDIQKSIEDTFIDEHMILEGDKKDDSREFQFVYEQYKTLCIRNNKKYLSMQIFSSILSARGFEVERYKKDGTKQRFIQGDSIAINDDSDIEEDNTTDS